MKKLVSWFSKIPKPTRRQMGWLAIPIFLAIPIIFLWATPVQALSWMEGLEMRANFFGNLSTWVIQLVIDVIVSILSSFLQLINWLLINLIEWFMHTALRSLFGLLSAASVANADQLVALSDANIVYQIWKIILGAANVFFFLALVIFSIMIITRQAGYNFKQAITKLIVVVLLANLSFLIANILIFTVGDSLTEMARQAFGYDISAIGVFFSETLKNLWVGNWWSSSVFHDNLFIRMVQSIFVLVVEIVFTFTLFRLGWVLIERAVRLVIATIFAPILLAFSLLPSKDLQGLANNWWTDIIKWVLVLPFTIALIAIAMKIQSFMQQDTISQGFIPTLINLLNNEGNIAVQTGWADVILMILIISLLLAASNVPKMVGVTLSAVTAAVAGAPGAAFGGAAKTAWGGFTKGAGEAIQAGAKDIVSKGAEKISPKAYKAITGSVAERKKRREAQAKVRERQAEMAAKEQIAQRSQTINNKYKEAITLIITNHNQGLNPTDPDYWKEGDKEQRALTEALAEQELVKTDPGLVRDREVAKNQQIDVILKEREFEKEVGMGDVAAKKAILERIQKVLEDKRAGVSDAQHKSDLRGLADRIFREARSNSPGAVPWKMIAHEMLGSLDTEEALEEAGYFEEWIPTQPEFAVSDKDLRRYEARQQREITDDEYKAHATGVLELGEAKSDLANLERDLHALRGANARVDVAIKTAKSLTTPESISQLRSLKDSLDTINPDQQRILMDSTVTESVERLLSDNQKNEIRELQRSTQPRDDRVNSLKHYLRSQTDVFGPADEDALTSISELLVDTGIDPDALASAQDLAGGIAQPDGGIEVKSYIEGLIKHDDIQTTVGKLDVKLNAANPRTLGYTAAVTDARTDPADPLTDSRIQEIRELAHKLESQFGEEVVRNPSVKPSIKVNKYAGALKKDLLKAIEDTKVDSLVQFGKTITKEPQVGELDHKTMHSTLLKILSSYEAASKGRTSPPEEEEI